MTVWHGDCLDVMRTLDADSVDAIVTDPPYGLAFMGKGWDHAVPGVEYWTEALRVAKPGAHLLAFGGTRTYHRLACAIEDAGWEVRDSLCWLYGTGFPKSHDVSKAIDRAAGAEREVVGVNPNYRDPVRNAATHERWNSAKLSPTLSTPTTDAAKQWHGWGTAIKPSIEPVIVAVKPRTAQQDLQHVSLQLGQLLWSQFLASNVETISLSSPRASRETQSDVPAPAPCASGSSDPMATPLSKTLAASGFSNTASSLNDWLEGLYTHASMFTTSTAASLTTDLKILRSCLSGTTRESITEGSSPTGGSASHVHLVETISQGVLSKCRALVSTSAGEIAIEPLAVTMLDLGGVSREPIILARKPLIGTVAANVLAHGTGGLNIDGCRVPGERVTTSRNVALGSSSGGIYSKADTPAVFESHVLGRWPANLILDEEAAALLGEPSRFFYTAKASRREREAGCDALPRKFMPTMGDGIGSREHNAGQEGAHTRNHHPTVKPIALMRWLVRLVTPPGGVVLDPFTGSGTTGIAAACENMHFIGIERDPAYVEIAGWRIAHWSEVVA